MISWLMLWFQNFINNSYISSLLMLASSISYFDFGDSFIQLCWYKCSSQLLLFAQFAPKINLINFWLFLLCGLLRSYYLHTGNAIISEWFSEGFVYR